MQLWQWLVLAVPAIVLVVSLVMIVRILMRASQSRGAEAAYAAPGHSERETERAEPPVVEHETVAADTRPTADSVFARPDHDDEPVAGHRLEGEDAIVEGSGARPRNAAD